jgi:hypothetical protein
LIYLDSAAVVKLVRQEACSLDLVAWLNTHDDAHAAETGRTVLTRDLKAGFAELPGVLAIDTP